MRKPAAVLASTFAILALALAPAAGAAIPEVFDGEGDVACQVQPSGATAGQRWCGTGGTIPLLDRSTVRSFDGVPIDVNVAFPPAPASGPDGPYPLVMVFHGYGGAKLGFQDMQRWLARGYAVFSMTDRGFHESCGSPTSRLAAPAACQQGFVRLLDTRYEVRDAQLFAGMLADEGRVVPDRIAATGGSYGGGLSMALAALKDRTMLPDGSLVPWTSPRGRPMRLAVAAPEIPWTDLAYSLVPNGSTLDYLKDSPYYGRFGVMKESWVNLLYTVGQTVGLGNYALPGQSASADLTGWLALLSAGEPYDGRPEAQAILDDITRHHSSYYVDHSVAPAPLLISSGFTDDLFPVDEATRFYNRTRAEHPGTPIGLFFSPNSGHMRGMSKADVNAALARLEERWFDHYLKGAGPRPEPNVTAFLQTCPADAPAGDPFVAADWASIAPGEIRVVDGGPARTVAANGGDPVVGGIFNPAPTGQACASAPGGAEPGSANLELPPAPEPGYTILGAPTLVADIELPGTNSQLAARLVDVAPGGGTKTLIARALWRPEQSGRQVFQLHANGYRVELGHVARLELLAKDASLPAGGIFNYGRPSNGQADARVANLDLRVPVAERPGSLGGLVTEPAPKVLPNRPGAELAPGYERAASVPVEATVARPVPRGPARTDGRRLRLRLRCPAAASICPASRIAVSGASKGLRMKSLARAKKVALAGGRARTLTLKLRRRARIAVSVRGRESLRRPKVKVLVRTPGEKARAHRLALKRVKRLPKR